MSLLKHAYAARMVLPRRVLPMNQSRVDCDKILRRE